jgi:asparagine synthase (glutamine-hydrolysing)
VVLNAFIEWGEEAVSMFNGFFAFAVWNAKTKVMFVARDRLGVKPFFYWSTPDAFIFRYLTPSSLLSLLPLLAASRRR